MIADNTGKGGSVKDSGLLPRLCNTLPMVLAATLAVTVVAVPPVAAQAMSDWVTGYNNKARLHGGQATIDGKPAIVGGVEISMPEHWKTYWRTPGENGVPPELDWSASENIATANLLFPRPERIVDKSDAAIGYHDSVVLPIVITPKDATKPVQLRVTVNYGVCYDQCVPAEAKMELTIAPDADVSAAISDALAAVPKREGLNASDPVLETWSLDETASAEKIVFTMRDPGLDGASGDQASSKTDAFIEAPDGLYVPLPQLDKRDGAKLTYHVDLTNGADLKALKGKQLTLTLLGATGQSEAVIKLP